MRRAAAQAAAAVTKLKSGYGRVIFGLLLFGISFGFVEAAVVVYLRAIAEPIRAHAGLPSAELFPLVNLGQLGPAMRLVKIELVREAATLLMLAAVAWAATRSAGAWLAAFALVFGVWELSFYASLAATIHWPPSLLTWDLLFLLPVPWTAPVLAPSIVAATLITAGATALRRSPGRVEWKAWMGMLAGCAAILAAFMWDWRAVVGGGWPHQFPWLIFGIGELIGIASLAAALRRGPTGTVLSLH